jgi:hypothetical protein
MLRFDLSQPHAGWAQATIIHDSDELSVSASYTPIDTIRDFVDAVAGLKTAASAHLCWFQEARRDALAILTLEGQPRS